MYVWTYIVAKWLIKETSQDKDYSARSKNSRTLLAFIRQWTPAHQALSLASKSELLEPSQRSRSQKIAETVEKGISQTERELLDWLDKESPKTDIDTVEPLRSWRSRVR